MQKILNHDNQTTTLRYTGISDDDINNNSFDVSNYYKSIDNGNYISPLSVEDKVTLSEKAIKELINYAYCLGKESMENDLDTDLQNIEALTDMLSELKL